MKRHGSLWSQITEFENLLLAARKAQRGKRHRPNIQAFNYNRENELLTLQSELRSQNYSPGAYRTFEICDPKPRMISAVPYRDRVVHHALCNVIIPILEASFIDQSYANRLGCGTHRAFAKFVEYARTSKYILQCDIRQYFPSIDLEILKHQIRRKIKCQETLWLIERIIDGSNEQNTVLEYFPGDELLTPLERRRGLPIGNLTSQFFANVYLNGFDHYIKESLKIKRYVRYVDDFCLFSDDHAQLLEARIAIEAYLATLRLRIHPIKSQCFATENGATFLGFRVYGDRIRVRNDNLRRGRNRLKEIQQKYRSGELPLQSLTQRLKSWEAHLKHGDTYRLRQQIFSTWRFTPSEKPEPFNSLY